jgi:integral membrane sensor domain MASE1
VGQPSARTPRFRRYAADGLRILSVTAAYYAGAQVGLIQAVVRDQITPFWPPTGIALAALVVFGVRLWPGITLGAFVTNVMLGPSLPAVVAISAGNTLAPLCAYLLLRRAAFRPELDRLRDALALVFLGALAGMLVSATVGCTAFLLAGALTADDFWSVWSVWWAGDAMGVLIVAPLLLTLRRVRLPRHEPLLRWVEAAALVCGTALVTVLVLRSTLHLLFLLFPFLIWAAFRFGLAGATPCVLILSVLTIITADAGAGPFKGHDMFGQLLTVQTFNGTAALTALLLSAVIAEREATRLRLEHLVTELADVVARLTR